MYVYIHTRSQMRHTNADQLAKRARALYILGFGTSKFPKMFVKCQVFFMLMSMLSPLFFFHHNNRHRFSCCCWLLFLYSQLIACKYELPLYSCTATFIHICSRHTHTHMATWYNTYNGYIPSIINDPIGQQLVLNGLLPMKDILGFFLGNV